MAALEDQVAKWLKVPNSASWVRDLTFGHLKNCTAWFIMLGLGMHAADRGQKYMEPLAKEMIQRGTRFKDCTPEQFLASQITLEHNWGMPPEVIASLRKEGIHWMCILIGMAESDLRDIPQIGGKRLDAIKRAIATYKNEQSELL